MNIPPTTCELSDSSSNSSIDSGQGSVECSSQGAKQQDVAVGWCTVNRQKLPNYAYMAGIY